MWILKLSSSAPLEPPHRYIGPFADLRAVDEYVRKRNIRSRCTIIGLFSPEEF
jgi:hypothetical protein